jgi:acetylornithine deacetylase/succinyl-diaminopimelate desuccinylase-like protein
MRHLRWPFAGAALLAMLAILNPPSRLLAQTRPEPERVKIEFEVDALSALNDLQLTADQIAALHDLSSDTAATVNDVPAHVDDEYKTALKEMRAALLSRNDDRIEQAQDKLSTLGDKQDPDSEPDFDNTDAAKNKAPGFLKTLSASQVAHYLAQNADDVQDPQDLLIDAIHQSRTLSDDDFDDFRDETSQQLGLLAGGTAPSKTPAVIAKASRFLARVRHLSAQDYDAQKSALEDEARKMVDHDPIPCIRHWMEGELADLLSNPELQTALKDWDASSKNALNKSDQ